MVDKAPVSVRPIAEEATCSQRTHLLPWKIQGPPKWS
uniref:Uncharacterized protein n=1 Tax=Picea sitchensis TaxID=3332 RepID=D5A8U4_PICSI|nr:unknown [Picea sitchensis]